MAGGLLAVLAKSCILYGPLVKRLRHGPFTAVTWVRFPYGSPKHPALKGAGCFFYIHVVWADVRESNSSCPPFAPAGHPNRHHGGVKTPPYGFPGQKFRFQKQVKDGRIPVLFLRVSSVPSLQRRNKKAVQVLDGLLNKKGVPHRGVPLFLVGHPLLTRALSDSPLDCRLTGCSSPGWPSE